MKNRGGVAVEDTSYYIPLQQRQQELKKLQQQRKPPPTQQHMSRQQQQQQKPQQPIMRHNDSMIKKRTISVEGVSGEGMSLHWLSVLEDAAQAARSCQSLYDGRHDNSAAFSRSASTRSSFAKFFCIGKNQRKKKGKTSAERKRKMGDRSLSRERDRYGGSGNPSAAAILDRSLKSMTNRKDTMSSNRTDSWPRQTIYNSVEDEEEAKKQRLALVHKINSLSQSGRGSLSGWGDSGVIDQSSDLGTSFGDEGVLTSSVVDASKTKPDDQLHHRSMSTITQQQQQQQQQQQSSNNKNNAIFDKKPEQFMHEQIEVQEEDNKEKEMIRSQSEQTIPRTPNKFQYINLANPLQPTSNASKQLVVTVDIEPVASERNKKTNFGLKKNSNDIIKQNSPSKQLSPASQDRFNYEKNGTQMKRRSVRSDSPTTSEEAKQGSATASSKTSLVSDGSETIDTGIDKISESINKRQTDSMVKENKNSSSAENLNPENYLSSKITIENYQIETRPGVSKSSKHREMASQDEQMYENISVDKTPNGGLIVKTRNSRDFYPNAELNDKKLELNRQTNRDSLPLKNVVPADTLSNFGLDKSKINNSYEHNKSGKIMETSFEEDEKSKNINRKKLSLSELPFIDSCPSPKKDEINTILEESYATNSSAVSDVDIDSHDAMHKKFVKDKKLPEHESELKRNIKNIGFNNSVSKGENKYVKPNYSVTSEQNLNGNNLSQKTSTDKTINGNREKITKPSENQFSKKIPLPSSSSFSSSHSNEFIFLEEIENLKKLEVENLGHLEFYDSNITVELPIPSTLDKSLNKKFSNKTTKWQTSAVYKCRQTEGSDVIFENVTYSKGKPPISSIKKCFLTLIWSFSKMEVKDEDTSFVRVARLVLNYHLNEAADMENDETAPKSVVHERKTGDGTTQWLEEKDENIKVKMFSEQDSDEESLFVDSNIIMEAVKNICKNFDKRNGNTIIQGKTIENINEDTKTFETLETKVETDKSKYNNNLEHKKELLEVKRSSITHGKDDEMFNVRDKNRYDKITADKFSDNNLNQFNARIDSKQSETGSINKYKKPSIENIKVSREREPMGKINQYGLNEKSDSDDKDPKQMTSSDEKYETADDENGFANMDISKQREDNFLHGNQNQQQKREPVQVSSNVSEFQCGGFGSRSIKDYTEFDRLNSEKNKYNVGVVEYPIPKKNSDNYEERTNQYSSNRHNTDLRAANVRKSIDSEKKVGSDMSAIIINPKPPLTGDKQWSFDKDIDFSEKPFATSSPKHEDFFDEEDNLRPGIDLNKFQESSKITILASKQSDQISSDTDDDKYMSPLNGSFIKDNNNGYKYSKNDNFNISSTSAEQEWFSCDQYESDKHDSVKATGGPSAINIDPHLFPENSFRENEQKSLKITENNFKIDQKHKYGNETNIDEKIRDLSDGMETSCKRHSSLNSSEYSDSDTETLVKESDNEEKDAKIEISDNTADKNDNLKKHSIKWAEIPKSDSQITLTNANNNLNIDYNDLTNKEWCHFECGHEKYTSLVESETLKQLQKELLDKTPNIPSIDWSTIQIPELGNTTSASNKSQSKEDAKAPLYVDMENNEITNISNIGIRPPPSYEEFLEKEKTRTKDQSIDKINLSTQITEQEWHNTFNCGHQQYVKIKKSLKQHGLDQFMSNDELEIVKNNTNDYSNKELKKNDSKDKQETITNDEHEWDSNFICKHDSRPITDKQLIIKYLQENENELHIYKTPELLDQTPKMNDEQEWASNFNCKHHNRSVTDKQLKAKYLEENKNELDIYKTSGLLDETSKINYDHEWSSNFNCKHHDRSVTDKHLIAKYLEENKNELHIYKTSDLLDQISRKDDEYEWASNFNCKHHDRPITDKQIKVKYLEKNENELLIYKTPERLDQTSKMNDEHELSSNFNCKHHDRSVTDKQLIAKYLAENENELHIYKTPELLDQTSKINDEQESASNFNCKHHDRPITDKQLKTKYLEENENELHIYKTTEELDQTPKINDENKWSSNFNCKHHDRSVTDKQLKAKYLEENENELDIYKTPEVLDQTSKINNEQEWVSNFQCKHHDRSVTDKQLKAKYLEENKNELDIYKTPEVLNQTSKINYEQKWSSNFNCKHHDRSVTDKQLKAKYLQENENELDIYKTPEVLDQTSKKNDEQEWVSNFQCKHHNRSVTDKQLKSKYLEENENELDIYKTPEVLDQISKINDEHEWSSNFNCKQHDRSVTDKQLKAKYLEENENELDIYKTLQVLDQTSKINDELEWTSNFNCKQHDRPVTDRQLKAKYLENNENELDIYKTPEVLDQTSKINDEQKWSSNFNCKHHDRSVSDKQLKAKYLQENENELDIYKTPEVLDQTSKINDEQEWVSNFQCKHHDRSVTNKQLKAKYLEENKNELDIYKTPEVLDQTSKINDEHEWSSNFNCKHHDRPVTDRQQKAKYLENNENELDIYKTLQVLDQTSKINDEHEWSSNFNCKHHDRSVTDKQLKAKYLEENENELDIYKTPEVLDQTSKIKYEPEWSSNFNCKHHDRSVTEKQLIAKNLEKNVKELHIYKTPELLETCENSSPNKIEKSDSFFQITDNSFRCGHGKKGIRDKDVIAKYLIENEKELDFYMKNKTLNEAPSKNENTAESTIKSNKDLPKVSVDNETFSNGLNDIKTTEVAIELLSWYADVNCAHETNAELNDDHRISAYLQDNDDDLEIYKTAGKDKNEDNFEIETVGDEESEGSDKSSNNSNSSGSSNSDSCKSEGENSDDLEGDIDRYFAENTDTMKRVYNTATSNRSSVSLSDFQGIENTTNTNVTEYSQAEKNKENKQFASQSQEKDKNEESLNSIINQDKNIPVNVEERKKNEQELKFDIKSNKTELDKVDVKKEGKVMRSNKESGDSKSSSDSEDSKKKSNTSPIFGGFKKLFFDFFKMDKADGLDKQEEKQNDNNSDNEKENELNIADTTKEQIDENQTQVLTENNKKDNHDCEKDGKHESKNNDNSTNGDNSSNIYSGNDNRKSESAATSTFYEFHMSNKPTRLGDDDNDEDYGRQDRDIRIVKTTHQHSSNLLVQVFARNDAILKEVEKQFPEYDENKEPISKSKETGIKQCPVQGTGRASRSSPPNNSEQSGGSGQQSEGNGRGNEFLSPNNRGGPNRSRSPSGSPNRRNPSQEKRKIRNLLLQGPGEVCPSMDTMEEKFNYLPNRVTVHVTPSVDDQITATLNTVENFYRMIEDLNNENLSRHKINEMDSTGIEIAKEKNSTYDRRRADVSIYGPTSTGFASTHSQMRSQLEEILKNSTFDGTPVDRDSKDKDGAKKSERKWVPVNDYTDSDGKTVRFPGTTDNEWMTLTDGNGQYSTAGGGRIFARRRKSRGNYKQTSEDSSETSSVNGSNMSGDENFLSKPGPETEQLLLTSVRGSRMRLIYFLDKTEEATTAATKLVTDVIGETEQDDSIDGLDPTETDENTLEMGGSDDEDETGGRLTDQIMLIFASSDLAAGAFGGIGGDPAGEPWDDESYRIHNATTTTTSTTSTAVNERDMFSPPESTWSEFIRESNNSKHKASERWTTVNSFHGGSGSVDDLDSRTSEGYYHVDSTITEDDRKWFSDDERTSNLPPSREELKRRHRSIEDGITSFDERIHNLTDRVQRLRSIDLDMKETRSSSDRFSGPHTDRKESTTTTNFYSVPMTRPETFWQPSSSYSTGSTTSTATMPSRYGYNSEFNTNRFSDVKTGFEFVDSSKVTPLDKTTRSRISTYRTSSNMSNRYSPYQPVTTHSMGSTSDGSYQTAYESIHKIQTGRARDDYLSGTRNGLTDRNNNINYSTFRESGGYDTALSSNTSYKTATTGRGSTFDSTSGIVNRVQVGNDDTDWTFDPLVTAHEYAEMISIFKYCSKQFRQSFNVTRNLRWTDERPPVMILPPRWVWGGPFADSITRPTSSTLHSSSIVHLSEQRDYSPIAVAIVSDNFYVVATSNMLYSQPGTIAVAVSRRRKSRRKRRTDVKQTDDDENDGSNGDSFDNGNGEGNTS